MVPVELTSDRDAELLLAIRKVMSAGYSVSHGPAEDGSALLAKLSASERQVYELIGEGLSVVAIADRLGLRPKTIEYFRLRAQEKLRLRSRAQLARHATLHHVLGRAA